MNNKQSQAIKTTPSASPPTVPGSGELEELMKQYAGKGVSTRAADNITPQIDFMQPLSPLVSEGKAKAGDIILNNAPDPIVTEFWFQPAWTTEAWFRFVAREEGGGFVGRWAIGQDWPRYPAGHPFAGEPKPPEGAKMGDDRKASFANGNSCIHYRHVAGIVWRDKAPLQFVIPFKGTGHTVYKKWNGKMMAPTRTGIIPPAFAGLYKISSFQKKNKLGAWYLPNIGDRLLLAEPAAGNVVSEAAAAFHIGLSLANAFESGELIAATPTTPEEEEEEKM